MATRRNLDRIEETQDGLANLRTRVATWFGDRRDRDTLRQYWTQLGGLERVLMPSIERVQGDIDKIRDLTQTGEVHAACRRNDQRVNLIDRYWRYFSDKWDQRDDEEVGHTLLAADEVVWSCWPPPRCRTWNRSIRPAPSRGPDRRRTSSAPTSCCAPPWRRCRCRWSGCRPSCTRGRGGSRRSRTRPATISSATSRAACSTPG